LRLGRASDRSLIENARVFIGAPTKERLEEARDLRGSR
jgi:hypothetical protein